VKLQRDKRNSSKVKFIQQQQVILFDTVVLLLTLFFLVIGLVIGLVFLSEDGFFVQELSISFVSEAIE